jgi:hypothetical protein
MLQREVGAMEPFNNGARGKNGNQDDDQNGDNMTDLFHNSKIKLFF